jgi:hypothetical protein
MLYIAVPAEWREENFESDDVKVFGHEGRNRMTAIKEIEGDEPVETHIILQSRGIEWRARHITAKIKDELNKGIHRESSNIRKRNEL